MVKIDLGAGKDRKFERLDALCEALLVPGNTIQPGADVMLAEGLQQRDFNSVKICAAALSLLGSNPRVIEFVEAALSGDTAVLDRNFDDGTLIAFLNAPLMQALLRHTPIPNVAFERLLIYIRRRLLECAVDPKWYPFDEAVEAAVSISIYGHLTDYVFPETAKEIDIVDQVESRLSIAPIQSSDLFAIAMLGAYRPLSSLSFVNRIAESSAFAAEPVAADLLRIQITEPLTELKLQADIEPITEINDSVSEAVRSQYEENPYPRWMAHVDNDPVRPAMFFNGACTGVNLPAFGAPQSSSVLVVGCGTGKVVIEEALLWRDSDLLAMDLSVPSLAFGQRRAQELELDNISFVQGDLLELAKLEPSFDYVTCTGVLHHMADPLAGWQALVDVCRPGGVIRIALYSEHARSVVRHVRDMLGDKAKSTSATDIRDAREGLIQQLLSATPNESVQHVFARLDMYSLSMCRDLLFHVQEQDFTIPMIKETIQRLGLNFCGFVDPTRALLSKYLEFAPEDGLGLDLDSWHKFETEHPDTFAAMYDFMVQKPL